ncbi:hypothetical protein Tco_0773119 [Tanacetum coccineum]|uniref:Uncharacterized protein n=1 Tax=Tanacetum coccineum TaxID=301880 RepID=A0ABQ4ZNN6_9ASTR
MLDFFNGKRLDFVIDESSELHRLTPVTLQDIQHLQAIYSRTIQLPSDYSSGPSTPTHYSLRSSRNGECSNCKHLRGKISVLKATMEMHMHPEQHTVNSAALFHEVLNEMEKLDLE